MKVRLTLASTAHSSQGMTNAFNMIGAMRKVHGFNYTAFSRASSFATTYIMPTTNLKSTSFEMPLSEDVQLQFQKEHEYSEAFVKAYHTHNPIQIPLNCFISPQIC